MIPYLTVAEDLEWLRDEWWLGAPDHLTDGHIRRGASAIGALVNDGLLLQAWRHYGFQAEPRIVGPDLPALAAHNGVRLDLAATVITGGGRGALLESIMIGVFRVDNPTTGVPADADSGFAVKQTAIQRDAAALIVNADPLVDRIWPLSDYLASPGIVRRGNLVPRSAVIDYFRLHASVSVAAASPSDQSSLGSSGADAVFGVMDEIAGKSHADGRDGLHFELLSIGQALGASRDIHALCDRIRSGERAAIRVSPPKTEHKSPADSTSSVLTLRLPGSPIDPDAEMLDNIIGSLPLDTPIYRTIALPRFRAILRDGAMALVRPSAWEDPFEDLVSKCVAVPADRRAPPIALDALRMPVYGQCWTLTEESDAIWRSYSIVHREPTSGDNQQPESEGVRVRTTIRRLLRALWRSATGSAAESCFAGAVRYMPARHALEFVAAEIVRAREAAFAGARGHAESLLVKRGPFSYEREVRLIYVDVGNTVRAPLFHVRLDPNWLLSRVTLDPRLNSSDRASRETEFRGLGFTREVTVSPLYERMVFEIGV
jgi:hypothetical protein